MAEDDLLAAAAGGIVVGLDDSPSARVALRHALREGVRRGTHVLALAVYHSQAAWAPQVAKVFDEDRLVGEVGKAVRQVVDEVVAEERERGHDVPRVRTGLRTGAPADVLSRISREAQLLVVGDRGRGPLASRLIGSVVLGVVLNAPCPVLVVHPTD
jgi:nucleotide-binding universal stress UspA family protein